MAPAGAANERMAMLARLASWVGSVFGRDSGRRLTLKTARLRLVAWRLKDAEALADGYLQFEAVFGSPAAMGLRKHLFRDEAPRLIEKVRAAFVEDPWISGFAVVDRRSRSVIGGGSFAGRPDEYGAVEISYFILPEFEGNGCATEVAGALTDFAFTSGLVRTVRAHTYATENASVRVLEKNGFENVGTVVEPRGLVWRWEKSRDAWLKAKRRWWS